MEKKKGKELVTVLTILLVAVVVVCGTMAVGTGLGWFGGDKTAGTDQVASAEQTETAEQPAEAVQSEEAAQTDSEEQAVEEEQQSAETVQTETGKQSQEKTEKKKAEKTSAAKVSTCTITIRCDEILKNLDNLAEGKNKYVPSNGVILSTSKVEFKDGDTVYDVLKRVCSATGINLAAKHSGMGQYIQGINNLFEFDCGDGSGWIYTVNGKSPNHSCSEHSLKNGDKVVWKYTCGD